MPHRDAVSSVGEGSHEPAAVEEPTGGDDGNRPLHRVDHLRQQQAGGHRAGVTTPFPALHEHRVDAPPEHLFGVTLRADRRYDEHAAVVQRLDEVFARRLSEARDLHALVDEQLHAVVDIGRVGTEVHAEWARRARLDVGDRVLQLAEVHGGAGEDPERTRLRGGRHQARARHPAHAGLHDRHVDPEEIAQARVQAWVHQSGSSWRRSPVGSTCSITASSSSVGTRLSGTSPSIASSKPVASTTSSTVTPG